MKWNKFSIIFFRYSVCNVALYENPCDVYSISCNVYAIPCCIFNILLHVCSISCVCFEFFVPLENFHSFGEVTIAVEGLQILTFARHFWPLSSEGSSAFHTYCDTGHPFIMVISEDPWHSHVMPRVFQWSYHYLFYRIWSVAAGIRTLNLPLAG